MEENSVNSVKAIACKIQTTIKVSAKFILSKLLVNAKISLGSFIYDCIDRFCFPNEQTKKIYSEHKILKVLPYLLMTGTDSALFEFIVIADKTCDLSKREMREIFLKIFLDNNMHCRLDLSSKFFDQFGKRNVSIRKQVGLYEFENIEHELICAICVSPKEYFELYGILYKVNKKLEGIKKGTKVWTLIIMPVEFYTLMKPEKVQMGLLKKTNMFMVTIEKRESGQLTDKRYLSCEGISSPLMVIKT